MKTELEKLIEIFEAKKDLAGNLSMPVSNILDSCIAEVKDLLPSKNLYTKVRLSSGKYFDYANPNGNDITIEDIAKGLATEFRYGGQTPKPYSVAQHSYYCSMEPGTPEEQLERLMHDASESIMKDIPKPLKNLLTDYQVVEYRVTEAINKAFNLPFPISDSCHMVDKKIFEWEYDGMMLGKYDVEYWSVEHAEQMFLARYKNLTEILKNGLRQVETGEA